MNRAFTIATAIALALSLSACAKPHTMCGVTYDSYGLLNADDKKNPDVQYEIVWGNVIWSVILVETVVMPIYFFGFSIFQPVGPKPSIKGAIERQPEKCAAQPLPPQSGR